MKYMKKDNLPEEIYFDEKVGSNGIHCLDYKNESDVKYIREDVVNKLLIAHVNNSLDLDKIERKLDKVLDNETSESLKEWLHSKRL
jgi:hypothetical protein